METSHQNEDAETIAIYQLPILRVRPDAQDRFREFIKGYNKAPFKSNTRNRIRQAMFEDLIAKGEFNPIEFLKRSYPELFTNTDPALWREETWENLHKARQDITTISYMLPRYRYPDLTEDFSEETYDDLPEVIKLEDHALMTLEDNCRFRRETAEAEELDIEVPGYTPEAPESPPEVPEYIPEFPRPPKAAQVIRWATAALAQLATRKAA